MTRHRLMSGEQAEAYCVILPIGSVVSITNPAGRLSVLVTELPPARPVLMTNGECLVCTGAARDPGMGDESSTFLTSDGTAVRFRTNDSTSLVTRVA